MSSLYVFDLSEITILPVYDFKTFRETDLKSFGIIIYDFLKVQITELRVNDIQMKFGKKSENNGFFLDGDRPICDDSKMRTAFVGIQNEKVVTSICKNSGDVDEHINHNREIRTTFTVARLLSLNYKISKPEYGYYKQCSITNFQQALKTCEKDGTSLPVPRSGRFRMIYTKITKHGFFVNNGETEREFSGSN